MLVFASHVPSAFAGFGALQPRSIPRPSAEEQYFLTLAEEHERAASFARQRLQQAQRVRKQHQQQQQREALEAQLRLQQQLAASLQVHTPQRSPYQTPARHTFNTRLPDMNAILEFDADDRDSCDAYAERMHRRTQERQKRAEEQAMLRALFEEQRREQAERVAELHRRRVEEAKAQRKAAEEEETRQHLAARAGDEAKLRQFFQALTSALNAQVQSEPEGAELERKTAFRRNTVPVPVETPAPAPVRATVSAPVSPKAPVRISSPAPSTSSDASDASLNSIAHLQEKYDSLRAGFTLPPNLTFVSSSPSPASSPSLLYNPTNAPVHAYEHALTGLLTELDAVESFGDEHVRGARRALARTVESELETLEEKKREAWRKQQDAVPVELTPAPVEGSPSPVESTPVVESESTPTESAPAAPQTATESTNPLAWLTSRLANETRPEEDAEVKVVRERLLARLAPLAPAFELSPAPATESAPADGSTEVESVPVENSTVVEPTESATAVEEFTPVEEFAPVEESAIVLEAVSEPAPVEVNVKIETTTAPEPESESIKAHISTESAPVPEVEPAVTVVATQTVPEPAPAPVSAAELESVLGTSNLETVAPVPEPSIAAPFVQVFPESESDSDFETDADLVSELADRKNDGFEML